MDKLCSYSDILTPCQRLLTCHKVTKRCFKQLCFIINPGMTFVRRFCSPKARSNRLVVRIRLRSDQLHPGGDLCPHGKPGDTCRVDVGCRERWISNDLGVNVMRAERKITHANRKLNHSGPGRGHTRSWHGIGLHRRYGSIRQHSPALRDQGL